MNETIISNEHGDRVAIESQGAKFTLSLNNTVILTAITRGDGKPGITHPCTPVFGPDRNNLYGLAQHGQMRHETSVISKQTANQILVSHMITDTGYPTGIEHQELLKLEPGLFTFIMTHTNTGSVAAALNSAEHCYFDAPQGFQGTKVNGQDITELIKSNINGIAIDLLPTNVIEIPGKPKIRLTQTGFSKLMLWVGRNPETGIQDTNYVCIEPAEADPTSDFFGSPSSMIAPKANRSAEFSLSLS